MNKPNKIIFYETESGKIPVNQFMGELSIKHRGAAYEKIELLKAYGTALKEPHVKPMKGKKYTGLWELRIKSEGDATRIFYFSPVGQSFVLLHGFVKKTVKTPTRELDRAKKYKDDYERRIQL